MDSSREQIEEIKARLDIVNIVNKYVELKQAGKNYSGLCPFHNEKTPSFIVSPELQRYKCFGCGETGDIFNFIEKIENIDFKEALEKLAKEAGVKLKQFEENTIYRRLENINKLATIHFYKQLKKHKEVLKYLYDRGITDESIKEFGIGYAIEDRELLDFIQKDSKYSKKELLLSGLFVEKEGKLRGKFYKRVMFPIRSSSGRVIAFTGRITPDNKFGPKYMNSPETPIYHKRENLYGQYESRQEIRKQDLVVVCEGTTDVISAHQAGIKNIVAPLGTAITKEQIEKISKLTKNALFLFDNDSAGQKALENAFVLSQQVSLNTYAANTSPYKDIDELIQKEPKKLHQIVKKKTDAFTYLLTEFIKDKNINNFEDYQKIVSWLKSMLKNVVNPSFFSFYVKMAVNITKIDPSKSLSKSRSPKNVALEPKIEALHKSKQSVFLQHLLFQDEITLPKFVELRFFTEKNIKNILKFVKKNPNSSRENILKNFESNSSIRTLLEDSMFSFPKEKSNEDEMENIFKNIVKEYFQHKERAYNTKIAAAESRGNLKESDKLLKEFQELSNERKKYEENSRL